MTRAHKVRAGIIAVAVLVVVTACVLLMTRRFEARPLSLVFERYSTRGDFFVRDMAFLWLTNSSDKTYYLGMAGGTNTLLTDTPIGLTHYKQPSGQSYLVNCEFSDQPDTRRPVSLASWGQCVALEPHSAVRLRVALPPEGQTRRVAALCAELPSGPGRFWTNSVGLSILGALPRSVGKQLLQSQSQPAVLRVWCDRELAHRDERIPKR